MKDNFFGSTKLSRRFFLQGTAALGAAAISHVPRARAQEPVTVQVWMNGTEKDQGVWLKDVAERFEAANPNVKVEWTLLDWKGSAQKIVTAAAGGTLPDLWMSFTSDLAGFAEQNVIRPLDDLIDKSELQPSLAKAASWRGQLFAIPMVQNSPVFNYRNDIVSAAGLDISSPPKTWDELANWAEKLTVKDASGKIERTGFFISTGHPYKTFTQFMVMLYSNGGRLFSPDGMTSAIASPQGIETVTFINDLLNNRKVDQPGVIQIENQDFGQGKIAMLYSGISVRGWRRDFPDLANTKTVGFAAPVAGPSAKPGEGRATIGSSIMVMKKNTEVPEQATALLKFMSLDPDNIMSFCGFDEAPPAILRSKVEPYYEKYPFAEEYQKLIESNGVPEPKHPDMRAMFAPWNRALDSVYLKGEDPKAALEAAAAEIDKLLKRSGVAAEESI